MKKINSKIHISWLTIFLIFLSGVGLILFSHYDSGLYQAPIGQIVSVKNGKSQKQVDQFNNIDYSTNQKLTVKILNGKHKNETYQLENNYSKSNATDLQYKKNQRIFLHVINHQKWNSKNLMIQGLKRDTSLIFLFWLTIIIILVVLKFKGSMALLSVIINATILYISIKIDVMTSINPFVIFTVLSIIFTGVTSLLIFGKSKETAVAFFSTIIGTALSLAISYLVLKITNQNGVNFEMMEYVTQDRVPLFFAASMIGSLGAIMDLSADITSSLFEVFKENPSLSKWQLFLTGRKIGSSIMGPLVNVLFLIFIAVTFPMLILFLDNGNAWGYTFYMIMSLGVVQSLISAIGIALTVPITSMIASSLCRTKVIK
ncbi:YibE/F family protein [Lactobacillus sp. S2-2]|uniref:YibE/F family protein n=1 Tax=Lactobacillus sp. S2-2 TaxID=2692917 RepID=UPI001F48D9CC|nr:YibE/F family protein [Lactobacillus sp. S2-2]